MAVVMPEEAAAMFARNPELARANPDAVAKVGAALQAKKAAHEATAKAAPAETRRAVRAAPQRPTMSGLNAAQGALKVAGGASTAGGRSSLLAKLILATVLGLVALEVGSLASGRYFNWGLGKSTTPIPPSAPKPASPSIQVKTA